MCIFSALVILDIAVTIIAVIFAALFECLTNKKLQNEKFVYFRI